MGSMRDAFGSGTIGVGFGNFASGQPLSSRATKAKGISRFMMPPDAGVCCAEVMIGACLFLRQWGAPKSRSRPTSPAPARRCLGLNFSKRPNPDTQRSEFITIWPTSTQPRNLATNLRSRDGPSSKWSSRYDEERSCEQRRLSVGSRPETVFQASRRKSFKLTQMYFFGALSYRRIAARSA